MRPSVAMIIKPDENSTWSRVTLTATVVNESGTEHEVVLYDQLRDIHELRPDIPAEIWMLTEFGSNTGAIQAALQGLVMGGSRTLIPMFDEEQNSLF